MTPVLVRAQIAVLLNLFFFSCQTNIPVFNQMLLPRLRQLGGSYILIYAHNYVQSNKIHTEIQNGNLPKREERGDTGLSW